MYERVYSLFVWFLELVLIYFKIFCFSYIYVKKEGFDVVLVAKKYSVKHRNSLFFVRNIVTQYLVGSLDGPNTRW
jgi:hypothetical protein